MLHCRSHEISSYQSSDSTAHMSATENSEHVDVEC